MTTESMVRVGVKFHITTDLMVGVGFFADSGSLDYSLKALFTNSGSTVIDQKLFFRYTEIRMKLFSEQRS